MKKINNLKFIKRILLIILIWLIPLIEFLLISVFTHDYNILINQIFGNCLFVGFPLYIITYFLSSFLLCCFSTFLYDKLTENKKSKKIKTLVKFIMCFFWIFGIIIIFIVVGKYNLMIINPNFETYLSDLSMQIVFLFTCTFILLIIKSVINTIFLLFYIITDISKRRKSKNT